MYESMTGGESWMLRETNDKPIKLKNVFIPNSDWRIHPDGASKSFRVERRQGERWTAAASFLVPIAACKPIEPPQTEAEPKQPEAAPMPAPAPSKPPARKRK